MREQPILRILTKQMFPFILVFGFYVIAHGELSPGGGFQGGVTLAAAFILYAMVFGRDEMHRIFPRRVSDTLMASGVLVYAGTGTYCLIAGYRFLDYTAITPSNPGGAESWGMTLVEYGVGITVSSVMLTIYSEITEPADEPGPRPL